MVRAQTSRVHRLGRSSAYSAGPGGLVDVRHAIPVIFEHALLPVKPGEEVDYESTFAEAKAIIAAAPGFLCPSSAS